MSTSTGADAPSENPQATVQQSVTSLDESVGQSGLDQRHEISRWSPNTSSLAPSTAGDSARGPSETERSVGASRGGSTIANHGSTTNNTMSNATTGSVGAARERTLSILEHGGQPAPVSERNAETMASNFTQNPRSVQQLSSSGAKAKDRRERNKRTFE
ncbi:hypothetical protein GX50_05133 [[Emmonsia] crescens]|uniref:Uncharacterized protein n=1 Tax=[Emmonsia] crescens TaxID=73230 RepID=A0A2B7Z6Q4_9EURO|nr:hypothetical protein GX50_05133 [Emmonsia crescens]